MTDFINTLKHNPKNPRTIGDKEFARLKDKIKQFPEMLEKRPIVYDENKMILGGDKRFRALKVLAKEGVEIKDTYFQDASDWTEQQKAQFIINDNISEGKWDMDLLANEWSDNPLEEWGINITGWIDPNPPLEELWDGMPEYMNNDQLPFRTLYIHFESQEDVDNFSALLQQKITDKTKYLYYPKQIVNEVIGKIAIIQNE